MSNLRQRLSSVCWPVILLALVVALIADQLSKLAVLQALAPGEVHEVIPGFFNFTLHFNKGAAFGLFAGLEDGTRQIVLAVLSKFAVLMLFIFLLYEFYENRRAQFCIGLILGGAAGNILDRMYRGEVVDFLDVYFKDYHWPAFNIADSCICVGVFALILFESWGKSNTSTEETKSQ